MSLLAGRSRSLTTRSIVLRSSLATTVASFVDVEWIQRWRGWLLHHAGTIGRKVSTFSRAERPRPSDAAIWIRAGAAWNTGLWSHAASQRRAQRRVPGWNWRTQIASSVNFERPPARIADSDADNLDCCMAGRCYDLALCRSESGLDEARDHAAINPLVTASRSSLMPNGMLARNSSARHWLRLT